MSYGVSVTIVCDEPECEEDVSYQRVNRGGMTKTFAGALAARDGWAIAGSPGRRDPKRAYCPAHSTKEARA